MATTVKFRLRRDTAANWTSNNPTLALGEPAVETDTRLRKTGDGTTAWTSLGYDQTRRADISQVSTAHLLGRSTAGTGNAEEIAVGTGLTLSAGTLSATGGGGTGTVTSVSVATANGVSGSVANATTTPAITLTLGAITPSTVNGVTLSGTSTPALFVTGTTSVSGTNTGDQTSVTGNAGTATSLQTARTIAISGPATGTATSFNGTGNITIPITALDVGGATTGTLAVARGGTGIASYAVGDILYASGSAALSKLAGVATGNVLISGGVTTAPAWGKVALTTHVSGTLPVANGGTGDTGTAWTAYTPTFSTSSGTLTSAVATGRYKTIGKTVIVWIQLLIATNGTGAGNIFISLPFAPNQRTPFAGVEPSSSGVALAACSASSDVVVTKYDLTYAGSNGARILVSGSYEQP